MKSLKVGLEPTTQEEMLQKTELLLSKNKQHLIYLKVK